MRRESKDGHRMENLQQMVGTGWKTFRPSSLPSAKEYLLAVLSGSAELLTGSSCL